MWRYNTPEELYHYGILGMRWGHRKIEREKNNIIKKYNLNPKLKDMSFVQIRDKSTDLYYKSMNHVVSRTAADRYKKEYKKLYGNDGGGAKEYWQIISERAKRIPGYDDKLNTLNKEYDIYRKEYINRQKVSYSYRYKSNSLKDFIG